MNKLKSTPVLIALVFLTLFTTTNTIFAASKENVSLSFSFDDLDVDSKILDLYTSFSIKNISVPQLNSFAFAVRGYNKLLNLGKIKNQTLTIIDFTLSSVKKRMWVLDMVNHKVLFNTVVAHGRNTGGEFATDFSNKNNSNKSSLGFYVTNETYYGKNGLSMFLDGQERGINDNARERYVVFHGAKYANQNFINKQGRLGRSLGCPAVPTAISGEIINKIKGKSCMFIYHSNKNYQLKSKLI